jgi:hypothetical protein
VANGLLQYGDPGYIPTAADIEADPSVSVAGGLGPLAVETPEVKAARQMQNRAQGFATAQQSPFAGLQQQSQYNMSPQQLAQIYATMAGGADDPTQVGNQFVRAMQAQQQIERQNNPLEVFMRMYGNVNPYDFETDSLQAFHENFVRTGQPKFNLLVRKNELTSAEQGFLNKAITDAQASEQAMVRMSNLAAGFDDMARRGVAQGAIAGGLSEWVKRMTGNENADTMLRTEFEQLRIGEVVGNLPPGVASDKDVALVLKGWPSGVSDPAYIAAFLRGMEKLKAIEHAMAAHQASFIAINRGQSTRDGRTVLDDWAVQAPDLVFNVMQKFGGLYIMPDMTPEQAAKYKYDMLYGGGGTGGAGQQRYAPSYLDQGPPQGVVPGTPEYRQWVKDRISGNQ